MLGTMAAMYSSSPPAATWYSSHIQNATTSTKTSTDIDMHTRHHTQAAAAAAANHHPSSALHHPSSSSLHHHQQQQSHSSSKSVQGGLSTLFSSNPNPRSHHSSSSSWSHSDGVLDNSSSATRPNSRTDVAAAAAAAAAAAQSHFLSREKEDNKTCSRTAAVNIPVSSSSWLKRSGERSSPVSVLQGPVHSRIRGSSLTAAAASSDNTAASADCNISPSDLFQIHVSEEGEEEGFVTIASSSSCPSISSSVYGQAPLDALALPVNSSFFWGAAEDRSSATTSSCCSQARETPAILEAREKLLRLVEESNGLASSSSSSSLRSPPPSCSDAAAAAAVELDHNLVPSSYSSSSSSAIKLLESAQARHKVFCDPTVVKAFRLAEDAHKGQFRRNGDLYLTHCVETALILAATGAGSTVVAAGLLHDAIDDSNLSQQLLRGAMGDEIADIVLGVSRLSEFSQLARDNQTVRDPAEADRLRNMILSMVDVRVVLIKLADRLHNMRTLGALSFRKQLRIANETLEIFAPLANRLGIWSWKAELEDLCFKHLKPEEYKELATRLSGCCREGIVMSSIHQLYEALRSQGVQFTDLSGRPKNLYSIYKKMMRKGRTIEEIFDVRGLRLIVLDEKSCYDALRIVHELWLQFPGQSKDYIAMPKPNGYQSLHTVVWGDDGYPLEVQIRTVAMHRQAEFGLAAHWRYKEDNSIHSSFILQHVEWARWVLTWHSEILDTKLRLSPLRADLKPPCPFPVHTIDCPYASMCCGPQLSGTEPLLIIKVENDNMIVQELPPGSTVTDLLMSTRKSEMESLAVSSRRPSRKEARVKVNHQFVDTFQQKLKMGDLVEVIMVVVVTSITSQPSPVHATSGNEQPCGKIALEFQREQLKRLYLDGGDCSGETRRSTPLERSPSVAGLM